ncbi:peptidase, C69 family [Streptococcus cristatus ATCC 51100]|uniref:Dipeptidase n=2 Tax=Streptococcus cristatus TaxID=45634 RepID=A0AAV3EDP0_STRCR|nr:C69 family dipeptidase [Streptococcus cristatus]EFX53025.1 peptidase, C69 family [Streptococcus cristatus ATCC 51100]EGU66845.1 peptidase, C69 family [Streptococcus cristatus ATCC 51100]KJQ57357.1 surface-anchored dipeptidase [Streptococcus cristatus]MCG7329986.1 C69 family dipeptidase [Streptococcus cristatus]RSJ73531.1 Dipeptidase [Streptococcus cristatus]
MKKILIRLMFLAMLVALLPVHVAQACSAFIVGKDLTADGSTLFGRTEDYPYAPDGGRHNQNYVVVPAKTYKDGDKIEDESNGFTYPHLANEMKYTAVYDSDRDNGSNGNFAAHGFNELGVAMTATVSATPNDKVLKEDPLVKDGLPEASLVDLALPRAKTAREVIETVAKVLDEKGSAEGNIIVAADKNELWYMEILSGHQYVAIKFPTNKYAVFANTYYLGHVDLNDKENVIASKDVEEVAKKADNYKTDKDGNFMIAKSYGPDKYMERNRSRTYAGIKWMDPQAKVNYDDEAFDLLREPTDPNKKYTVHDVIAEQRNRFEHLPEYKADDLVEVGKKIDGNVYKYALGNENVIDAHVYQIKPNLPNAFGGVMWLGLAQSRNTPYVPFYGNVEDTYEAFKNRSTKYDGKSWYWTVWHIDQMVMKYPEIFGNSIQEKWKAKEAEWDKEQTERDAKYANYTNEQAKAAGPEVTKEALERSEKIFKEIKAVEAEMEEKIKKEKGKDADLVYTGYNKANLLAEAEKGKSADKASDTKKDSSSQTTWIVIGVLVVLVAGFFGYKQFNKKKEEE